MESLPLFYWLAITVVAAPLVLSAVLGLAAALDVPLGERRIANLTKGGVVTGLVATLGCLALMLYSGDRQVPIEVGNWVLVDHYHFQIKFVFDRLSVPFALLSFLLCGTIGAFADIYLHKEVGFGRFFLLYAVFLLGMVVTSLAGTIETLFFGWELVGLSSAMLVAFFHERANPVRNGLHVWVVYRVADAALLLAALALHHMTGEGDFERMMGSGAWPLGAATLTSGQAFWVGLLLLAAAAGKSALVPFSGWLPRAMEGPTPSSAIFYGALSVHLGAFLLLRVSPLLDRSPELAWIVIALGMLTAVFSALIARVQTDIKSILSFACLTQIGIIFVEIGLGLRYLALVHIIGHACLRTLQFLRAPTVLRDYSSLENAIGSRLPTAPNLGHRLLPERFALWTYRFSLERGYLDAALYAFIVHPFQRIFQTCDRLERRWTDILAGRKSRESDEIVTHAVELEELP